MATQNSNNTKITNNADGFDQAGGTTARKLTVTGADITLTGSGTAVHTFPATTSTLARTDAAQTFTGVQTFSSTIVGSINGNAGTVTGFTAGAGTLTGPATSGVAVTLGNAETITGVKTMSGLNSVLVSSSGLTIRNPADTFKYTVTAAAIAADRTLTLPLITGTDTLAVLGLAQTYTAVSTYTAAAPQIILGANTTTLGSIKMFGNTSGDATVRPAAVAGTATVVTLPNASSTLPIFGQQITFTGPTAARSIALPDAAFTVARTDAGQTFTGVQNFTSPDVTTSITTATTSFTAFAGATTLLTIGGTGASASLFAPSTLDTTSSTTGAIRTSGGVSAAKALNIGTTATIATSVITPQIFNTENAQTATTNAITFTRANRNNRVTNNSAATLTITLSTTSAAGGDMIKVKIVDFSAVAQTITWVNTENSTVTAPVTSNGSTTLPLTVGFEWNTLTSKWRCIASC